MTKNMDRELLPGKVVTCIRAPIKKMREMGLERCFGLMGHRIRGNGGKAYSMVTARCRFQTGESRKDSLKTTFIKVVQITAI